MNDAYWDIDSTGQTIGDERDDVGTGLVPEEMTSRDAETYLNLNFEEFWTLTDEYPVLQWQVEDVSIDVGANTIAEGDSTTLTVELTLDDGSTITASEVAAYDSDTGIASVDAGTLDANSPGETEIEAEVAGETDSTSIEVVEPPKIDLVEADFDADAAVEGTEVQVDATYKNTGGPGFEDASLTVDGEEVASDRFEVDADDEETVSFTWSADEAGAVELDDEQLGELDLVEPGTIEVDSIDAADEAGEGDEYEIDVELANNADVAVSDVLTVEADGEEIFDGPVTVDADGTTKSVENSHDQTGSVTHEATVHETSETADTEIVAPAEFSVTNIDAPSEVTEGDNVEVEITVENVGGAAGDGEISLSIGDETIETEQVGLDAGDSDTVDVVFNADDSGNLELTTATDGDEASTSVAVGAADDQDEDADDDADDGLPGFGAVAALGALLLAVLITRRRI